MRVHKEYSAERVITPLSMAVHRPVGGGLWMNAGAYEPPMPRKDGARGWPVWILEDGGKILHFASTFEMAHVAHVFARRVLPTSWQMSNEAGGPNRDWVSQLDPHWREWPVRQAAAECLRAVSG
ncbi:hypothetical protein [Henriciella sp.]|uniref:hypothetical protein n=1 Tax=Henriciella sp. TaxID=1968823 RepID=UPI00261FA2CD|nr:hypothetical protein [Henriciella sp.]